MPRTGWRARDTHAVKIPRTRKPSLCLEHNLNQGQATYVPPKAIIMDTV